MSKYITYKGHRYVRVDSAKSEATSFLNKLEKEAKGIEADVKKLIDIIHKSISAVKSVKDGDNEEAVANKISNAEILISGIERQIKSIRTNYSKLNSPGFF